MDDRVVLSRLGVVLRLGTSMRHAAAAAAAPLLSVHFIVRLAPPPPPAAARDGPDSYFAPPFSLLLNEASWECQARLMFDRVAGNLVYNRDFRFLLRRFCDYSHDALQFFLTRGGGGSLTLSVSILIPDRYHPLPHRRLPDAAAGLPSNYEEEEEEEDDNNEDDDDDDGEEDDAVEDDDEEEEEELEELEEDYYEEEVSWSGGEAFEVEFGYTPASASAVALLKRVVFGEENGAGCRETSCAVCTDDFEATSALSVMPCGHGLHSACLEEWLRRSNLCPLCRFSLPAAD